LHAVILRRKDAGESDRRLTLLSQEFGVLDVIAKGARKSASRLSGASEPLSACIMNVAEGKRNWFVTQVQPVTSFPGLRGDYERLSFALALTELAAAVLPHEQPAPDAFTIVVSSLRYLEAHPKPLVALVWAELQLMQLSGFFPDFSVCVLTGEPVKEAMPFVSPHAGGYVSLENSSRYTDRFQCRAEVLYGIVALAGRSEPPNNLRFAEESLRALLPFWKAIADRALPANEEIIGELSG
jgi:DNA repair protein RecO (recombination protein O)